MPRPAATTNLDAIVDPYRHAHSNHSIYSAARFHDSLGYRSRPSRRFRRESACPHGDSDEPTCASTAYPGPYLYAGPSADRTAAHCTAHADPSPAAYEYSGASQGA